MPAFFLYLLKFSISLTVVYLFYQLLLRRLTFYQYNRWYLLGYPLLCFAISFIDITPLLQKTVTGTGNMFQYVPVLHNALPQASGNWLNTWAMAGMLLAIGSLLLLGRLVWQYVSLLKVKKQASLLQADDVALYQIDKNITPFSFANGIYVNIHQHSHEELQEIIRHEYVHVKQRHSIDIILAELICILNWYNPFAWLLRHTIRQNLEFIADQQVLQSGIEKKDYQYLLLKVVGGQQYRIVNAFNFSSLKKRIAMMNRLKSAKVHLVKFTFILPLAAVLLLAFRQQMRQQQNSPVNYVASAPTDTIPDNGKTPQAVTIATEASEEAFIKRHSDVQKLAWGHVRSIKGGKVKPPVEVTTGPTLYVYLTNGKQEAYLLSKPEEVERFKSKYNELPPLAPPPPPPAPAAPPTPPAVPAAPFMAEAPVAPEAPEPAALPVKRTAPAKVFRAVPAMPPAPPAPVKLPENITGIHIDNTKATVTLKDGTVEKYNLENEQEKKAFQDKYGKLMPPPPPIPAVAPTPETQEVVVKGYASPKSAAKKVVAGVALSPSPAPKKVTGVALSPAPNEKVVVVGYASPKKVTGVRVSPSPAPKKVTGVQLSPLPNEKVVVGYASPKRTEKVVEAVTLSPVSATKKVTGVQLSPVPAVKKVTGVKLSPVSTEKVVTD